MLVCTDPDVLSPACHSDKLLRDKLVQLRAPVEWYLMQYLEQASCLQLLDWQHQDYRLSDYTEKSRAAAMQRVWTAPPLRAPAHATYSAGPCGPPLATRPGAHDPHDGLAALADTRMLHEQAAWPETAAWVEAEARAGAAAETQACPPAQYCIVRENMLLCETWSNRSRTTTSRPLHPACLAMLLNQPVTLHHLQCSICEDHAVLAFLARLLHAVRAFLTRLLQPVLAPDPPAADPLADDSFWAPPRGLCDQSTQSRGCDGSLTRLSWLEPSTRAAQCDAMVTTADSAQSVPVELCLLDSILEATRLHMNKWHHAIDTMVCQAAGLAACPLYGFFYMQTQCIVKNARFVHNTVLDFYSTISKTCQGNLDQLALQAMQECINKDVLEQCSSLVLGPVRRALQQSQQIVTMVIKILFYTLQIFIKILNLHVTVVIVFTAALPAIVMCIGLLIARSARRGCR